MYSDSKATQHFTLCGKSFLAGKIIFAVNGDMQTLLVIIFAVSLEVAPRGRTLRASPRRRSLQQYGPQTDPPSFSGATQAPTSRPTSKTASNERATAWLWLIVLLCCCCCVVVLPCVVAAGFGCVFVLMLNGAIAHCLRPRGWNHDAVAPASSCPRGNDTEIVVQAHLPPSELPVAQVVSHTPAEGLRPRSEPRAVTTAIVLEDSSRSFSRLNAAARSN